MFILKKNASGRYFIFSIVKHTVTEAYVLFLRLKLLHGLASWCLLPPLSGVSFLRVTA